MSSMRLEIATAERLVYSENVEIVVAPGTEGEFAVLPYHASMLTELRSGELRVVKDGSDTYLAVSGGFIEVMSNAVTILADSAERSEEIDLERAEQALATARENIANAPASLDLQSAMVSMHRAAARVSVARRRRRISNS